MLANRRIVDNRGVDLHCILVLRIEVSRPYNPGGRRPTPPMNRSTLRALDRDLDGDVVFPGHPGYDSARMLWNAMIDKRPSVIVRCLSDSDVAMSIRFASEAGLALAVRGGGHSVAGNSSCDGGLIVDLSRMRQVTVDPRSRRAHVAGGAVWADVDGRCSEHGLHTTGGVVSSTGVAGLALGGGIGWLSRLWGHTCDNLASARVVTASGEVVTASERENPDLLWGLRGGGGNFGVVTRFEFSLHPVTTVVGGWLKFPWDRARAALETYRDVMAEAPDRLSAAAILTDDRDLGPVVALVPCYVGRTDDAERWIDALRAPGPLFDDVGEKRYVEHQTIYETPPPPPMGHYWKSNFFRELDGGSIDALISAAELEFRPGLVISLEVLGGAASRVSADEAAFAHRAEPYNYLADAGWVDPTDAERSIDWARRASALMEPHLSPGNYVNYMSEDDQPDPAERVRRAYGSVGGARLISLKDRYDPGNVFRLNHNIPPSAAATHQ